MAAYWHLLLPYKITYSDKPEMEAAFQEKFGEQHYEFVGVSEYEVQSPLLPNGKRLTFPRREKTYALKPSVLQSEWQPLCRWIWEEFRKTYMDRPERGFYSSLFDDKLYVPFVRAFERLGSSGFNDVYEKKLEKLDSNCFVRFDELPSQVVYEGWPLPLDESSSMEAATFLYGYEKMNIIAAETAAFWEFARHIRIEGVAKCELARYMQVMGF